MGQDRHIKIALLIRNAIVVGWLFQGAVQACDNLPGLEEFKTAQTVKVNPDKPQEQGRFLVLEVKNIYDIFCLHLKLYCYIISCTPHFIALLICAITWQMI